MKLRIWFPLITLATSISAVFPTSNLAQVIPDQTLGAESSVINSSNELRSRISGGATRGSNLFHSFQDFNIGEGLEVYFANPQTVIQDPIIAVREIDSTDPRDKSNNDCWNGNFDRRKRRLVYVGRGGFSPEPEDFNDGTDHYIAAPGFVAPEPEPEDWDIPVWQEGDPLIEANAVRVDSNGEVYLVAELESEKAKSLVCDVQETEEKEEKATVTNRQSN